MLNCITIKNEKIEEIRIKNLTEDTIYNIQLSAEPHFDTILNIPNVLSTITSTKKIYQYIDKKITFTSSSDDHADNYTLPSDVEVSGPPSAVTILNTQTGENEETASAGKGNIKSTISWEYTLKNNRLVIARQPT